RITDDRLELGAIGLEHLTPSTGSATVDQRTDSQASHTTNASDDSLDSARVEVLIALDRRRRTAGDGGTAGKTGLFGLEHRARRVVRLDGAFDLVEVESCGHLHAHRIGAHRGVQQVLYLGLEVCLHTALQLELLA